MVPEKPGISLKRLLHAPLQGDKSLVEKESLNPDELESAKQLREIYNGNDLRSKVLHEAEILEGSVRNTGIHAAGIIIAPRDLTDLLPVCVAKDSPMWVTQIEGSVIEDAGVIKMDFLGLKTLNIIKTSLELIRMNYGIEIIIDKIPLDDEQTFTLYQKGETIGTFQFESPGMQKYLRDLKPDKFEDLIAMNALYRPGPLEYIPNFINRKHGREAITYDLEEMEEYLQESYGITVYQEQVMLLAQKLAGFSKGDADVLRKAMGKKQKSVLDKMKGQFIGNASKKGFPEDKLQKIWTDWEAFAQYAFNKSHSTCYAFIAYQTAYLKSHYPSEYMAAVLNHAGSIEKITFFMEECKRMGLKVLGPDINESLQSFAVNSKGEIRIGLGGLKGVGEAAVESIIEEREKNGMYNSIFDLIKRVNQRTVNKKSLESLAMSGTFDCFPEMHRAQFFYMPEGDASNGLEKIVRFGNIWQNQSTSSQNTLFGDLSMVQEIPPPRIPDCPPWSLTEILDKEKEVTGMFLSGHPLDHYRFELKYYDIMTINDFTEFKGAIELQKSPNQTLKIAGLVTSSQHKISRAGKKYGSITLEDFSGKVEITLFGDQYIKFSNYFTAGTCIHVKGSYEKWESRNEWNFRVNEICLLETIKKAFTKQVQLTFQAGTINVDQVSFLQQNLKKNPGKSRLRFIFVDQVEKLIVSMKTTERGIEMNDEMAEFLENTPLIDVQIDTI
jgi:DNA polymerase-3 subunit alpha